MAKTKKIPLRVCVGCRETKPKREMTRIVRTPQNTVEIDPTGKKSGRGAYICPNQKCLNMAVKKKSLEKALKCKVSGEIIEELQKGLKITERRES